MTGPTLHTIAAEQAAIEAIMGRIESVTNMVERSDLRGLGRQRRELVQIIFAHFSTMELSVYPHLMSVCDAAERPDLEAMRREGGELATAYRLHIARWNADNLLADWTQYRQASLALIARMRSHFSKSHRVLHPILQRLPARENRVA